MTIEPASRTESDYLGPVVLPAEGLHGVHTVRGLLNLTVSDRPFGAEREFVRAFAHCKWAAALANRDLGRLTGAQADALVSACREMADGALDRCFVVDLMEGSGGTSTNMNVNEVLANRAQQILGGSIGRYDLLHPNDHVNCSQSTNDVYPAALKIALHQLLQPLADELVELAQAFSDKAQAFASILHLGRTCLQDAQPMLLGQVFGGYETVTRRLARAVTESRSSLLSLPLGGTAIGTGFGAPAGYKTAVYAHLRSITGVPYEQAADPFDGMQNLDTFARVSGELRTVATSLAKIASDLIILSSGPQGGIGEVVLPAVQAGSSMMPGKINPVIPMSMVQIGFAVLGNDVCIAQVNQAGQLEINHFEPLVAHRMFDSVGLLTRGVSSFTARCVRGLQAHEAANESHVLQSSAVATALVPKLGYGAVSRLVRQSVVAGRPFIEMLESEALLERRDAHQLIRAAARVVE